MLAIFNHLVPFVLFVVEIFTSQGHLSCCPASWRRNICILVKILHFVQYDN
jgi:hypothetical protein